MINDKCEYNNKCNDNDKCNNKFMINVIINVIYHNQRNWKIVMVTITISSV